MELSIEMLKSLKQNNQDQENVPDTMELSVEMLKCLKRNDPDGVVLVSPSGNLRHTFKDINGNVQMLTMRYGKREEDFAVLSYRWNKNLNLISGTHEPVNFFGLDIGMDYWVDFIQHFDDKELSDLCLLSMGTLYKDKEVYSLYLDDDPKTAVISASRGWMWQEVSFTRKILNLKFEWHALLLFCIKYGPSSAVLLVKEYLLSFGIDDEHIIDEKASQMKSMIAAVAAAQRGDDFETPLVSCLLQPPTAKLLERYYALNQSVQQYHGAFNVLTSKNFTFTSDRWNAATCVLRLFEKNIDADILREAARKSIYKYGGTYNHEGASEEGVPLLTWADDIVVKGSKIVEGPLKNYTIDRLENDSKSDGENDPRVLKVRYCSFTRLQGRIVLSECTFSDGSRLQPKREVLTYGTPDVLGNGRFNGTYSDPIYGPKHYPICNELLIPQGKIASGKGWIDIGFPFEEYMIAQRWCPAYDEDGTRLTNFCYPFCCLLCQMPNPTKCGRFLIWLLSGLVWFPLYLVFYYFFCGCCCNFSSCFEERPDRNPGVEEWHLGCLSLNTCLLECCRPLICLANYCFRSSGRWVAVKRLYHNTALDGEYKVQVEDIPSQLMIPSCPTCSLRMCSHSEDLPV